MKKVLAIINPISGTGSKKNIPDLLGQAYNASEYELFLTYTKAAGHAEELARRAASEGYDHVIAVGGDGTVNEVARGLVGSQTALGIVPKGSGNGLARSLGLSMKSDQVIQQLVSGRRIAIDSCELNGRPFFCTCGMGFDAAVSRSFAEASTRGPVTYLRTMIEEYRSFKPETYRLDINDGERTLETEAFVLVVANATQYGNNAYIAPEADLSDGLLDLAIIRPFPILEAAVVLGDLMLGKLADNKHYETERIKSLRIERPTAGAVHIDGEPLELGTTIDIKLRPHSLHVIIPQ
jgi:lipid kinase, YegS/Rv2252/BmrU family